MFHFLVNEACINNPLNNEDTMTLNGKAEQMMTKRLRKLKSRFTYTKFEYEADVRFSTVNRIVFHSLMHLAT